jgi:hypothetical protein
MSQCLIKYHTMPVYSKADVQLHVLLTLELTEGERSNQCCFTLGTQKMRGRACHRASLNAYRKIFFVLLLGIKTVTHSSSNLQFHHYTDCTSPVTLCVISSFLSLKYPYKREW